MSTKQAETGKLFGELWPAYTDEQFKFSVELLGRRFRENGFDMNWFKGKKCLDIGCGGGRYSIALSSFGAEHVIGMDVGEAGIADAKKRAADIGLTNVEFRVGSVLELPFPDETFNCVLFSGILQHTERPVRALKEIGRVTKSGGMFYSLTYSTEGVRWNLVQMLRHVAQRSGFADLDKAVALAGFPANKRRTYLDDLFVPMIDFYSWERLEDMIQNAGFSRVERWKKGRLDHEENLNEYRKDLDGFRAVMSAAAGMETANKTVLTAAKNLCEQTIAYVDGVMADVKSGSLTEADAMKVLIGQGHHRVVAWKT